MLVTTRGLISDGGFSTPQRHELRQGAKPLSIRLAPENFTAQGSVWWGHLVVAESVRNIWKIPSGKLT